MQAHTHPHPETPEVYYVPPPSIWPLVGSIALLTLATGFVLVLNKMSAGTYITALGAGILLVMLFGWFGNVIRESLSGKYDRQVDRSFRWGMSLSSVCHSTRLGTFSPAASWQASRTVL